MHWLGRPGPAQAQRGWLLCISTVTNPRCILQQNVNYSRSACKCKAGQQEKKMIREQEGTWGGVEAVLLAEAVLLSRWFQRRSSFFLFLSVFFFSSLLCRFSFFFLLFCFFSFVSLVSLLSFYRSILPLLPFFSFFFPFLPCYYRRKTGGGRHGGGRCAAARPTPVQHVESGRQVVSLFRRLFEQKKERN